MRETSHLSPLIPPCTCSVPWEAILTLSMDPFAFGLGWFEQEVGRQESEVGLFIPRSVPRHHRAAVIQGHRSCWASLTRYSNLSLPLPSGLGMLMAPHWYQPWGTHLSFMVSSNAAQPFTKPPLNLSVLFPTRTWWPDCNLNVNYSLFPNLLNP